MYRETVEHLFFNCMIIKNFWLDVLHCYNVYKNTDIKIEEKDIILCFVNEDKVIQNELNIIFLYGKRYIQVCKLEKNMPSIKKFRFFIQEKIKCINLDRNIDYKHINTFFKSIDDR